MQYPEIHPAVRLVREGRYTVVVPEVDLATVGTGAVLHVLADGAAVCGRKGSLGEILEGCDPRAAVVMRRAVCGRCREIVGDVPGPRLAEEIDGGHSLGVTRTALDRERARRRKTTSVWDP